MSNPAPLLTFVEDELARSASMAERCVAGTLTLLRADREHQRDLADALVRQGPQFQQRFVNALAEAVRRELGSRSAEPAGDAPGFTGLELMDEARVEADIEISRAMQLIDSTAEWERRELQTFTSTLCGLDRVSEDSKPVP
jgi:transcription initiation factor TFIID subunit TAF12